MPTIVTNGHVEERGACAPVDLVSLERTRFFPRQLVGPDDLTQDQVYFREKARRHNRLLHGWGIVCGALVQHREGCVLTVTPGYVLGPWGDEILIDEEVSIDVCRGDTLGPFDCAEPDPWCGDRPRLREGSTAYLAVRYVERATRPIQAPGCGCGCNGDGCEYSRTRDSFEFGVLTELPESYRTKTTPPKVESITGCVGDPPRATCPPCPADPWVVLCDFQISGGTVSSVDCDRHRRYVASFGSYWFSCGTRTPTPPATICHRVFGYEWEGISAMPQDLAQALTSGDLTAAIRMGLQDLGTVEFTSGTSANPQSKLISPLPFVTDALAWIYVYPADGEDEPATAQAAEIAELVVTSRWGINPTVITPTRLPANVGCPLVTVVVLGISESG
jgi:hypothetical protein